MPTRKRKVEIYKLTISGLPPEQGYGALIRDARGHIGGLEDAVARYGTKSHALHSAQLVQRRLRMQFLSFTTGHRPDILDTADYTVEPNPLPLNQTGVEWTHVLGGRVNGRYLLLVEKHQSGIWPGTIEQYLQDLVGEDEVPDGEDRDPITVSMEAEPGDAFLTRLEALDRITRATVRTVRPNPGWADLESELASESAASDSHKTDVTMRARRNGTLRENRGIIAAIRGLFHQRELDFAEVEGRRNGRPDCFNTQRLGKSKEVSMRLDAGGQVVHEDAWTKLNSAMDELG